MILRTNMLNLLRFDSTGMTEGELTRKALRDDAPPEFAEELKESKLEEWENIIVSLKYYNRIDIK